MDEIRELAEPMGPEQEEASILRGFEIGWIDRRFSADRSRL
jgi:hypothetical protein